MHQQTDVHESITQHDRNNINDPEKKHRLRTVSNNILLEGLIRFNGEPTSAQMLIKTHRCPARTKDPQPTKAPLPRTYEGCSNMNASSFITFFTYMLQQKVIPFWKELFVAFKMASDIKKHSLHLSSYRRLCKGHSCILKFFEAN